MAAKKKIWYELRVFATLICIVAFVCVLYFAAVVYQNVVQYPTLTDIMLLMGGGFIVGFLIGRVRRDDE